MRMELKDKIDGWFVNSTLDERPPDIVVCVGTCHFHLHKDVLMEKCDYFKAMFSSQMQENAQDTISMKLIEKRPFEFLAEGFYSGQLSLTFENIFEVTLAAHILQVSASLYKQCYDFMISLINSKKCFEILHFSQFHNLQEVYDASRRYCVIHFNAICKEDSFLNLTLDQVVSYLSDEFLVAEGEFKKLQTFIEWCDYNDCLEAGILEKAVCKIMHCTNYSESAHFCKEIAQKLSEHETVDDKFMSCLNTSMLNQDLMMFWARLSDSKGEGLVDVVKLSDSSVSNQDATCLKVDTMTGIVEKPGFDLGSAVCVKGPYVYVCGGGPNFGRMDWIRDIWRYSVLEDNNRWHTIGKLPHPLRYHVMIPIGTELYVFGGFGKFRSKNCNLESFDTVTGVWSQRASVPTWEIKPVATYHHQTIYYVCRDWNIHAYHTSSNIWTALDPSSPIHSVSFDPSETSYPFSTVHSKPLSCFVLPSNSGSFDCKFVVLSQGNNFQTHTFAVSTNSKSFRRLEPDCIHNFDSKTYTFVGSCVLRNEIVVLLKTISAKDMDGGDMDSDFDDQKEKECTPIRVMYLSSETGQLSEKFQLNNVVKMQSVLAVPFVPTTFNISSSI